MTQPGWEAILGVPKPAGCNLKAACCSVAVPSVPVWELFQKAAQGDETSRDFLSVFVPHASHQAARAFYPEDPSHIDRVLAMVTQQKTRAAMQAQQVVFYHCRNLGADRRCQIYEDRPAFCRDYPASPMALLVKGCGYQSWVAACKTRLAELGYEIVGEAPEVVAADK